MRYCRGVLGKEGKQHIEISNARFHLRPMYARTTKKVTRRRGMTASTVPVCGSYVPASWCRSNLSKRR